MCFFHVSFCKFILDSVKNAETWLDFNFWPNLDGIFTYSCKADYNQVSYSFVLLREINNARLSLVRHRDFYANYLVVCWNCCNFAAKNETGNSKRQ